MKVSKKLLSILLAVTMVFGVMCVAAFAEGETESETEPVRYITGNINISISTPVAGEQSNTDTFSEGKFTVSDFKWYDSEGKEFTSSYESGETYTAILTVVPNEGYLFDSDLKVTVNDEATITVSAAEDSVVVTTNFTCDDGASGGSIFTTIFSILRSALKVVWDFILHFIGY